MRDFLFNWQTLIGSVFAAIVAATAAAIAWKAAMKQIALVQSERDRREKYAANLARTYLSGVKEIVSRIEKQEKKLAAITEQEWKQFSDLAPSVLRPAQAAFLEPNPRPQSHEVEQYREELPLFLFSDLRLVFRLESDLNEVIGTSLAQQNIPCSFPIDVCQKQIREALDRLNEAINRAERSFERYDYE